MRQILSPDGLQDLVSAHKPTRMPRRMRIHSHEESVLASSDPHTSCSLDLLDIQPCIHLTRLGDATATCAHLLQNLNNQQRRSRVGAPGHYPLYLVLALPPAFSRGTARMGTRGRGYGRVRRWNGGGKGACRGDAASGRQKSRRSRKAG